MGKQLQEILKQVVEKRQELDALLETIPLNLWEEPIEPGGWTLKDLAAHVTWYEREVIPVFLTHVMEGSDLWLLPLEERNRAIYEMNKNRTLDEILAESKDVFKRFVQAAATLDDADLENPTRFQFMPLDWKPYDLITTNSNEHYEDHIEQISAWLKIKGIK